MIKVVALMKFKPDAPKKDVDAFLDSLRALPGKVPTIRNWSVGSVIPQSASTYTHSWVCDFDDVAGWQAYAEHPDHRAVSPKYGPIGETPIVLVFDC